MVILQLMVAHLLGDFVFQSNSLLKRKYKSWHGTLEHALVIWLFTALALFPYWNSWRAWAISGIIFLVHFTQDVLKVEFDKRYNKDRHTNVPFFLDQLGHLLLIFLIGRGFENVQALPLPHLVNELYFSPTFLALVVGLILFTFTADITKFQFLLQKNKKAKYKPDYWGMAERLLAFAIFYLLFLLLLMS